MAKLFSTNIFRDEVGAPLANGLVYTYVTRSSTPKTTYTTEAGNIAHPNPVVLDAAGRAELWLDTDRAYRIDVRTSAGTRVGNVIDDVIPVKSLSATGNAGAVDITDYSIITTSGNLALAPVSGSAVSVSGVYTLPTNTGDATEVLVADGVGSTYWGSAARELLGDLTPQLGADLDANAYQIAFDTGTGILDSDSNEQLLFITTASAVNYLNITNKDTGVAPIIAPAGSDTDIDLTFAPKGDGATTLSVGTVTNLTCTTMDYTTVRSTDISGAGSLTFKDYTNTTTVVKFNGVASAVNYLNVTNSTTTNPVLIAPVGSDTNIGLTLAGKGSGKVQIGGVAYPSVDGTADQVLYTDGAGVIAMASQTTIIATSVATQTQMETATSTTALVTPGRLHSHPGIAKAWVYFTYVRGVSFTVHSSYGVASVTDPSGTSIVITFTDTGFSSTDNYAAHISSNVSDIQGFGTTFDRYLLYRSSTSVSGIYYAAFYGDQ